MIVRYLVGSKNQKFSCQIKTVTTRQMKFRWQFSTMTKKNFTCYYCTMTRNEIWIFENFQLLIILFALKPINKNEMYNRESHGESKELDNGWFRPHFYAGLILVCSQIRFLFYNFGICSLHFAVCWVAVQFDITNRVTKMSWK